MSSATKIEAVRLRVEGLRGRHEGLAGAGKIYKPRGARNLAAVALIN